MLVHLEAVSEHILKIYTILLEMFPWKCK